MTKQFGQLGDLLIEFGQPALDAMDGLRGLGGKADSSRAGSRPSDFGELRLRRAQTSASSDFGEFSRAVEPSGRRTADGQHDQPANVSVAPLLRLIDQGLLALAQADNRTQLTERGIRQLARESLEDVFTRFQATTGSGEKPAPSADPVSEAELFAAVARSLSSRSASCPLAVSTDQIESCIADCTKTVSLAVLIDMDYSMSRFSRFFWAKKSALAIMALAENYFPADRVEIIGFHSHAQRIAPADLPLLMPKPVGVVNKNVSIRLPVERSAEAPQHFTNLQMAIQLANETMAETLASSDFGELRLRRAQTSASSVEPSSRRAVEPRPGDNKLIFVVLDGEPSACITGGELLLQCPPRRQIAAATLAEADNMAKAGGQFTVFALIDDCFNTDWVGFVDRMVRRTRGVSFYCGSEDLAGCMLESYIAGKQPSRVQPAGSAVSSPSSPRP